ncbi:MAG: tetratricopeptide repeat protein [Oligoflexia bacterium]|nr:tetratricopeptide repeat protein [Oligoflexia bacterium]
MSKYRIKMTSGRVIGPLEKEQIGELFEKSYIEGEEECQVFPNGSWKSIREFKELESYLIKVKNDRVSLNALDEETKADSSTDESTDESTDNGTKVFSEIGKFREKLKQKSADADAGEVKAVEESKSIGKQDDDNSKIKKSLKKDVKEFDYKKRIERRMRGEKTDTVNINQLDLKNTPEDSDVSLPTCDSGSFVSISENEGDTDAGDIKKEESSIDDGALEFEKNSSLAEKINAEAVEATRIVNPKQVKGLLKNKIIEENIDRTVVISSAALEQEKLKKQKELLKIKEENEKKELIKKQEEEKKQKELAEAKKKETELDSSSSTVMINLEEVLSSTEVKRIEEEAVEAEKEQQDLIEANLKMDLAIAKKNVTDIESSKVKTDLTEEEKKKLTSGKSKKKKLSLIMTLVFIGIIYNLYFDEEVKDETINPVNPEIIYPQEKDVVNEQTAHNYFEKAVKASGKYTYYDKMAAANYFRTSLEFQRDTKTLGLLVLTYAELLPHIVNIKKKKKNKAGEVTEEVISNYREKAGNVIFKLIKEGQIKSLSDENLVIGTALFYSYFKKYLAAINILNRYKYANEKGKLQLKYYITYLDIAIKAEKFDIAKKLSVMLEKQNDKPQSLYIILANYAIIENDYDKAEKLLIEANKRYPDSVALLLEYSKILLYKEDYQTLTKILKIIKELKAEYSGIYFSKYLEYMGILAATQKNYKTSATLFTLALSLNESVELRSRLATLDSSKADKSVNGLILDSKIWGLIKKARDAKAEYNWDKAFSYAIDAADLSESNIGARIFLSQLQAERGYFSEALSTLTELSNTHKLVADINFVLAKTYIDAYKFDDARNVLSNLAQTSLRETTKYASTMGYLFFKSGKNLDGIKWLSEAVNRDPLDDEVYFYLAKIYLKLNKFDKAKEYLLKVMDLDPANIDYKILYSKIIYEMESSDAAIGYLSSIVRDSESKNNEANANANDLPNEDKAKIYGEIATYYHRSGQFKQFSEYKEKLEKFQKQSKGLYEFLIQVAKLEDKEKDVIENCKKLLAIDPGNLEIRMFYAKYMLQGGKFDDALAAFMEVQQRLDSYPKVLYYLSKIYLLKGNMDEAKKYAKMEITSNPEAEFGYLLQGDIYMKEENYVEAQNSYKKAQAINQTSSDALIGLAQIGFVKGNYESSLELYGKAVKLAPNDPELRKKLGMVYKLLGQGTLAAESFKMYLELSPDAKDKPEIQHMIKQLE